MKTKFVTVSNFANVDPGLRKKVRCHCDPKDKELHITLLFHASQRGAYQYFNNDEVPSECPICKSFTWYTSKNFVKTLRAIEKEKQDALRNRTKKNAES